MSIFHKITSADFSPLNITWLRKKKSMSFNKPTGRGNPLNFIQSDTYSCEKLDIEVFISHTTVTLNESQGHPNLYQN